MKISKKQFISIISTPSYQIAMKAPLSRIVNIAIAAIQNLVKRIRNILLGSHAHRISHIPSRIPKTPVPARSTIINFRKLEVTSSFSKPNAMLVHQATYLLKPPPACDYPLPPLEIGSHAIAKDVSESVRAHRARVFQDTVALYQGWPSTQQAIANSCYYKEISPLPPSGITSDPVITVEAGDTLDILIREARASHNPVGLNLANNTQRGGGVRNGAATQEEELCRRSDYLPAMEWFQGSLDTGCLYTPHVTAFREGQEQDYKIIAPVRVSFLASAARHLRTPAEFVESIQSEMKERIRIMLRSAALNGHRMLVLGALGCGAFNNPCDQVAECFRSVLAETEFQGYFDRVIFGLYVFPGAPHDHKDRANLAHFQKVFPGVV